MLEAMGFIVWVGLLCCQVHRSTSLTGLSHATTLLHCISLGYRTGGFGCLLSSLPAQNVVQEILVKQSTNVQEELGDHHVLQFLHLCKVRVLSIILHTRVQLMKQLSSFGNA